MLRRVATCASIEGSIRALDERALGMLAVIAAWGEFQIAEEAPYGGVRWG